MLQLTTKWMTNTLAKKSIQTNDFIKCANESKLYILSYGEITSSGKNTYNYKFVDSEGKESEGNNAYLDALTKLILGYNQKGKANKDESESAKKNAKISNNLCDEYKRLEANLKKAILAFNDFKVANNITTLQDANEAQNKAQQERRKAKQDARREEVAILKRIATLRKWAKETKRLDLLQALNEKILEM
jgi:hypothetical protein